MTSHDAGQHPAPEIAGEHLLELLEDRKDLLRAETRTRRSALDARFRARAAEGIAHQVGQLVADLGLGTGDTVACYVSRAQEPGTLPTLEMLRGRGLRVIVPVLGATLRREWGEFTAVADLAHRAPGRPLEPERATGDAAAVARAALVLVPALLVDGDGIRLGLGGGWYDRVLQHADPQALVAAVVHADEVVTQPLPRADHDVPVTAVLTPDAWWRLTPDAGRPALSEPGSSPG